MGPSRVCAAFAAMSRTVPMLRISLHMVFLRSSSSASRERPPPPASSMIWRIEARWHWLMLGCGGGCASWSEGEVERCVPRFRDAEGCVCRFGVVERWESCRCDIERWVCRRDVVVRCVCRSGVVDRCVCRSGVVDRCVSRAPGARAVVNCTSIVLQSSGSSRRNAPHARARLASATPCGLRAAVRIRVTWSALARGCSHRPKTTRKSVRKAFCSAAAMPRPVRM
jgi:hypothetical protein